VGDVVDATGAALELNVGDVVGASVAFWRRNRPPKGASVPVGSAVGLTDGTSVVTAVGAVVTGASVVGAVEVGDTEVGVEVVDTEVGVEVVGAAVGACVGAAVGAAVGVAVGKNVGPSPHSPSTYAGVTPPTLLVKFVLNVLCGCAQFWAARTPTHMGQRNGRIQSQNRNHCQSACIHDSVTY
jgi:hypothetical protein